MRRAVEPVHAHARQLRGRGRGDVLRLLRTTAPPAPPAPPAPAITVTVSGTCPSCTISVVGTGFAPSSSIDLAVEITSPPLGSFTVPGFATTDANGVWSASPSLPCDFDSGPYVGPFEEDVTATDSTGRSASAHVSATYV